jgi:hypothetical protein
MHIYMKNTSYLNGDYDRYQIACYLQNPQGMDRWTIETTESFMP